MHKGDENLISQFSIPNSITSMQVHISREKPLATMVVSNILIYTDAKEKKTKALQDSLTLSYIISQI